MASYIGESRSAVHACVCVYVCMCLCVCMYVCVCVCMYVCINAYGPYGHPSSLRNKRGHARRCSGSMLQTLFSWLNALGCDFGEPENSTYIHTDTQTR